MLIKPLLSGAIVFALLSAVWTPAPGFQVLAIVTACLASVFAAAQAGGLGRYVWMAGFVVITVVLNPVFPIPLGGVPGLAFVAIGLSGLLVWVHLLDRPVTAPSVADVLHPPEPK